MPAPALPAAARPAVLTVLAAAALLVLAGCGGTDSAATDSAATDSAAGPATSTAAAAPETALSSAPSEDTEDADVGGDLCSKFPLDQLNPYLEEVGEPMASAESDPADGNPTCLFTGEDPTQRLLVTSWSVPFDEVLAGRDSVDATAGPRSAWVESDRVLVTESGDGAFTVTDTSDGPVDLATVLTLATAASYVLG